MVIGSAKQFLRALSNWPREAGIDSMIKECFDALVAGLIQRI
jgi:hypothetical protein